MHYVRFLLVDGFALAWVLGFIVPGAPGGIGIREVILAGLHMHKSLARASQSDYP